MKNIIKKYLSLSLAAILLCSCDGFMDINTNPNYPADADVNMLLPSAEIAVAGIVGGDMELVGGLWSQHYTQNASANQYNTTVSYTLSNTSYSRFWSIPYTFALPDLNNIVKKATEKKLDNYYMAAEIMSCFTYHMLSSWYEDIPYTESLQGEGNLYPAYDKGSAVNDALITRVSTAVSKLASAKTSSMLMTSDDMVFGGNMDKWAQFGTTLKLKLMMRNFDKYKNDIMSLLTAGGFLTSDAGIFSFTDKENGSNPLYKNDRRRLNTKNNIAACATLVNFLQANNDPRITVIYDENANGGYFGLNAGDRPAVSVIPAGKISKAKLAPTDGVYFMSVAESNFLQAEAWARLGDAAKAKAAYETAVTAAFDRWSMSATTFIADGGAYAFDATSTDKMLKCILTQKWVAAARCQAWDSYFDITRTGIPALGSKLPTDAGYVSGELSPVVDSSLPANEFPKRMIYPKGSSDNNTNAPTAVSISAKQWWQK